MQSFSSLAVKLREKVEVMDEPVELLHFRIK